jgi:hypothetical protein
MDRPDNSDRDSAPLWARCPPGEIERLGRKLRARRRRRYFLGAAAAATAAAAGGAGLWWWLGSGPTPGPDGEYDIAGLKCSQVQQLAKDYGADKLKDPLRDQVKRHVARCPHCGPLFKEMGLPT